MKVTDTYFQDGRIVVEHPDGTKEFYEVVHTGGIDDNGEYVLVLDGPAEGEKAYV